MARRFRFNLDPVLRLRKREVDERRREFAEVNRMLQEERQRREDIHHERIGMQEEIVRSFEEQAPFQSIVATYNLIGSLENEITESMRREAALEQELEKRRIAMIEANKQARILEILKERRRTEFLREEERQEQAVLDELSIQAQGRRKREERLAQEEEEARVNALI